MFLFYKQNLKKTQEIMLFTGEWTTCIEELNIVRFTNSKIIKHDEKISLFISYVLEKFCNDEIVKKQCKA